MHINIPMDVEHNDVLPLLVHVRPCGLTHFPHCPVDTNNARLNAVPTARKSRRPRRRMLAASSAIPAQFSWKNFQFTLFGIVRFAFRSVVAEVEACRSSVTSGRWRVSSSPSASGGTSSGDPTPPGMFVRHTVHGQFGMIVSIEMQMQMHKSEVPTKPKVI